MPSDTARADASRLHSKENGTQMGASVLNFLNGIAARIAAIVGAVAFMTAAAILIGLSVFNQIASSINELADEQLVELVTSSDLMTTSGRLRDGFTDVLLAADEEELTDRIAAAMAALEDERALLGQMKAEDAQRIGEMLDDVETKLTALGTARSGEFRGEARVSATISRLRILSEGINQEVRAAADAALGQMERGGEDVVGTVDASLRNLMQQDVEAVKTALQIRAELNLYAGAALAFAATSDATTAAMLEEIASSADAKIATLAPVLGEYGIAAEVIEAVESSRRAFGQVLADDQQADGGAAEVLRARQDGNLAMIDALDDIQFDLVMKAEGVAQTNEGAIRTLLDEQVARIDQLARLSDAVRDVFSAALTVAIANDQATAEEAQASLTTAADRLGTASQSESTEINELLAPAYFVADPLTGIAGDRKALLRARVEAREITRQAALSVQQIPEAAKVLVESTLGNIAVASRALKLETEQAAARMTKIAIASLVIVALALALAYFTLVRPMRAVAAATERLAGGDLAPVEIRARRGEIGRMATALRIFREGLAQKTELEARQRESERARQEERARADAEARERQEREHQQAQERLEAEKARIREEQDREGALQAAAAAERRRRAEEQKLVVSTLAEGLGRLSQGDFRSTIDVEFSEGYEKLRHDFNAALKTLSQLIGTISASSDTIASNAGEITAASGDLSRRTENTAATLEETAAALSELTAAVSSSAEGARKADELVRSARDKAEASNAVVEKTVRAMGEIETSSNEISKIIEVIDDIAFQTNLLALNAGVEAARAGEAGKGFAVVATEVRALAQRASRAAQEINALISRSGGQVSLGVELVGEAGEALRVIARSVSEIAVHVSDISSSASEQASGIDEINIAVAQLDQTTQQNVAMFEETSAASQSLSHESQRLNQLIASFQTNQGGDVPAGEMELLTDAA